VVPENSDGRLSAELDTSKVVAADAAVAPAWHEDDLVEVRFPLPDNDETTGRRGHGYPARFWRCAGRTSGSSAWRSESWPLSKMAAAALQHTRAEALLSGLLPRLLRDPRPFGNRRASGGWPVTDRHTRPAT
jgi:hypothetical protein